jgi:LysM repeat protein
MAQIRLLLFIGFAFLASALQAQPDVKVQGTSPDLHLVHKVVAKETWYAIAKLYNLSSKEIATYNGIANTSKLSVGQSLKIPLVASNFTQTENRANDEVYVPLYHVVNEKEWMFRISQNHNKVPIPSLEKWNNVTNDQLRPGMNLVVGYLKVKQTQSPLAKTGSKKFLTGPVKPKIVDEPFNNAGGAVGREEDVAVVQEAPKKEAPPKEAVKDVAVTPPAAPVVKEERAAPVNQPVQKTTPVTIVNNTESYNGFKGGYFRNLYAENGKAATGNAGIFRSTSGWKDGKYYALMNNVPAGTIVKVTFPSTNKSVYAKVLGQLPEMRESMGLTMRLSDAAAAELGAELGKFYVDVKY